MPIWNPSLSRYPHYIQRISLHKYLSRCLSTVYALSSGQGKCGVAVVRVTGDKASEALTSMTDPPVLPRARIVSLRRIIHPVTGERLDHGLVLWFPGPRSFTGEDSCELQIHGGPAVITAVLDGLSCLPGFQPAQPGDFTKRAFYNGKLDLTSVEGLGDLIHAETEAQRKQALQQMEGALGQLYSGWRETLLHCRANIEAFIDFSEDENIEEGVIAEVETKIRGIMKEMKSHLSDDRRGERLRSGLKLAILGRPNVGKSSFLNILVQRPAAIVSPTPGTTRDIVETTIDFGGYPVVVSDTAGLRNTEDVIEMEGIKRALARSKEADIAVIILDAKEVLSLIKEKHFDWENYLISFFCDIGVYNEQTTDLDYDSSDCWIKSRNYIILINKVDLIHCEKDRTILRNACKNSCLISIKTRDGFDEALLKLKKNCSTLCQIGTSENPTLTAARHRIHISSCLESLKSIIANDFETRDNLGMVAHPVTNNLQNGNNLILSSTDSSNIYYENTKSSRLSDTTDLNFLELDQNLLHCEETLLLAAHHLQKATNHLGYVTGHVTTEDVLNHIFSAFCIGK